MILFILSLLQNKCQTAQTNHNEENNRCIANQLYVQGFEVQHLDCIQSYLQVHVFLF